MATARGAIMKLAQAATSSKKALSNYRRKVKEEKPLVRGIAGAEIVAGGLAGGLIDGLAGGTEKRVAPAGIPVVPIGGALLGLSALIDYPGSSHVGAVGIGAVAYSLGSIVRENV